MTSEGLRDRTAPEAEALEIGDERSSFRNSTQTCAHDSAVAADQMRRLALERRSSRDDRRSARVLLRVLHRTAAGHSPYSDWLDRRRGSGLRRSQLAAHGSVR